MTLNPEQENRLQVIRSLSELIATKGIGGTAFRPTAEVVILADWVMGERVPVSEQFTLEELLVPDTQTPRVIVHKIEVDGLPDMENYDLSGRVAFIYDGSIVSGWPLSGDVMEGVRWGADSDVGRSTPFSGVTHWVEFPVAIQELAQ